MPLDELELLELLDELDELVEPLEEELDELDELDELELEDDELLLEPPSVPGPPHAESKVAALAKSKLLTRFDPCHTFFLVITLFSGVNG